MMRGLIARLLSPPQPAPGDPARSQPIRDLDASLAARREARLAKPERQSLRFVRAREKVEQLRCEYAMQMVDF